MIWLNGILRVTRSVLSRAARTWRGKIGLGVIVLATLAVVALMNPIRESDSRISELANGWVTNCAGPEFSRFSQNGNAGPGPERPVFKLNDKLLLAVPKKNWPSTSGIEGEARDCRKISDLPPVPYLYFVISGNWSAGYKPEDIPIVAGNRQLQPDVATVRIEREMPERRSTEELQKLDQSQRKAQEHDSAGTREIGGLTCLVPKPGQDWFICSGSRTASDTEVTRLRYRKYSDTPFILVLSEYTSARYGIHMYWKAWISDVSHALDIDRAIWNSIEEWNLFNKPAAQAAQRRDRYLTRRPGTFPKITDHGRVLWCDSSSAKRSFPKMTRNGHVHLGGPFPVVRLKCE